MRLLGAGLIVLFVLAGTRPARAEPSATAASTEPTFADRFFRGTSPGELPAPKVLVVTTFYAASIASVIVGTATLLRAGNQGDEAEAHKLDQPPGFCNDLASPDCLEYRGLLAKENETRTKGFALLGVGGLAVLAGALTAELWPNERSAPSVALEVDSTGAALSASGRF